MKKNPSIFLFLFFILLSCNAFATKTLTLTTYYPAPTAAYNQIKLATNSNAGCTGSNNGTVFVDKYGNLNACMNGIATNYPQQAYNAFCSYSPPTNPCTPACAIGFTPSVIDVNGDISDTFQISTSPNTFVVSYVCGSGSGSGAAGSTCNQGTDCQSGYCVSNQCSGAPVGAHCNTGSDCTSGNCVSNICGEITCSTFTANQGNCTASFPPNLPAGSTRTIPCTGVNGHTCTGSVQFVCNLSGNTNATLVGCLDSSP